MNIKRLNADFGNSTYNVLADSYYFELTTSVAEISKEEAEGLFTTTVDNVKDLLDRLLITTMIDDEERFFMVGKLAEANLKSNSHIGKMHDKITSHIPYVSFLASMAYYYKVNNLDAGEVGEIEIDKMQMMLPIWLLKKEDKFSTAQNKMANRFIKEHKVSLMTAGQELDLTIKVNAAKCHIESEVSRWALKYKMVREKDATVITKRIETKKFDDVSTVLIDVGGGSTDAVLLPEGLNAAVKRDSFQVINIDPFLGRLNKLLVDKLIQHFADVRLLEKFIVDNYKTQKYILKNPNTGEKTNLTEPIVSMLKEYADMLTYQVTQTFNGITDKTLKYIYIGGEAPILSPYINESIVKLYGEDIAENNHLFLADLIEEDDKEILKPNSRIINLVALEILSLNELHATV